LNISTIATALAHIESGRCRLISRNHNEFKTFPELCKAIASGHSGSLVLDGEMVYLGKDGKPRLDDLMRRREPQYFYAFDLLYFDLLYKDGRDLRGLRWSTANACSGRWFTRRCYS